MVVELSLHLADDALLIGHRNSEWTGHGPNLEQDIAISNIALDLIGQARLFYQYAASMLNANRYVYTKIWQLNGITSNDNLDEDDLAYLRDAPSFSNHLITEIPKGDWAVTVTRQFFVSVYQQLLYADLAKRKNGQLAAIAEKALKEVRYHLRWSGEWVIRLGDGTEESRQRMEQAIDLLWPYTNEFFVAAPWQVQAVQEELIADPALFRVNWMQQITDTLQQAQLTVPSTAHQISGGKTGTHTEHLGYLLAEMQYLQRTYPQSDW